MNTPSTRPALLLALIACIGIRASSMAADAYVPDFGKVAVRTVPLASPKVKDGQAAFEPSLSKEQNKAKDVKLTAIKAAGKLSSEGELILYSEPGKNFKMELTAKYNIPVPTKLASNLLLEKASILPPEAVAVLKKNHNATWHFDTETRPGFNSVEGEGEVTFDLIGMAPGEQGKYTFDLNVGLFDKISFATKVMTTYAVTLITDPKVYDETPPLTMTPTDAPLPWTASDGRVIQAKFLRLDGEAVVVEMKGKEFAVPFSKLKPESVELAKKLGGVAPVSPPGN